MPSRRALLATAGSLVAAGCAYSPPSPTPEPTEPPTATPSPTPPPGCDDVEVADLRFETADTTPDGNATAGSERSVLVVTVESATSDPPALVGRLETCDGAERIRRELPGEGTHTIEFGPYAQGCVGSVELGFAGCEG